MKMINNSKKALTLLLASWLCLLAFNTQADISVVYYHNDALGSPVAATDETGAVLWREDYAPYGQKLGDDMEAAVEKVGYTGHRYDSETGLVYAGARMYDPALGRFMGIDPVSSLTAVDNPVMFNRYAYGNNNPYRYTDPNGESPIDVIFLAVDVGRFGLAVYSGNPAAIQSAALDVGASLIGVASPVPGVGQALKAGKAAKVVSNVTKGGDNFVDGYRAVSKAEADDIAKNGFRPNPNGRSMQDKWFSETREGAEKFKKNYSDLDDVVKAKVPKDVYDRSYKHPNIDNTGPGFCVSCDDLSRLK